MQKIAIEEHFSTAEHIELMRAVLNKTYPVAQVIEQEKLLCHEVPSLSFSLGGEERIKRLEDIGPIRLKTMDDAGIYMEILSLLSPGVQIFDDPTAITLSRNVNKRLADAAQAYPGRFNGFASIPIQNPAEAARELERAVRELGLKGASINSHVKGEYLDQKKFWTVFEKAESLGVPIYLHPRVPSPSMAAPYLEYPALASAMCGFAAEVSVHVMRLICSGVFDSFPGLKIIIGHMGESLGFFQWRIDTMWGRFAISKQVKKKPSEYFKKNIFVTTSGMFSQPALQCICQTLDTDNILFAVDYPSESNVEAVHFLEQASIPEEIKAKIFYQNARRLFNLA